MAMRQMELRQKLCLKCIERNLGDRATIAKALKRVVGTREQHLYTPVGPNMQRMKSWYGQPGVPYDYSHPQFKHSQTVGHLQTWGCKFTKMMTAQASGLVLSLSEHYH